MTFVPLITYLRTYRKRTALTHEEMAFLCGTMSGTSFTRHESAERFPALRTALAYELILGVPLRDIYEGVVHETKKTVRTRALGLCGSLEKKARTRTRDHKIAYLKKLIADLGDVHS